MVKELSNNIIRHITDSLGLYYLGNISKKQKQDKSEIEEKIEDIQEKHKKIQKDLKKSIFEKPFESFDERNLNEIIDAFSRIGKKESFVSNFMDSDVSNLLIMFNKWINLEEKIPAAEEVFVNETNFPENSMPVFEPNQLRYEGFIPEEIYSNIESGEVPDYTPGSSQQEKNFYIRKENRIGNY
ncbi:hypothetical protein GF327_07040 [Candidatus Woesearchaeota archaeon]|nr:hypothetical protein [Candidatus Woesearchaeota archaeon]